MTKKVRITSFLTAAVLAFTMGGVKLEKTNDYEGEHISFSIVATAEAETTSNVLKAMPKFPEPSKVKADVIYEKLLDQAFFIMNVMNHMPEAFDLLPQEYKDIINNDFFTFTGDYYSSFDVLLDLYTKVYDPVVKLEEIVATYLDELIPLQKDFKPSNGQEMYTMARRLCIETESTLGLASGGTNVGLFDAVRNDIDQLCTYLDKMGPDYDFDANFKKDLGKIKPLYDKIYKNLAKFYSNNGYKFGKGGTRLFGQREETNVLANLEPIDENAVLPFEKMLDPCGSVDEPFEEEMATVGLAFGLVEFYDIGGVAEMSKYTGYDYNSPEAKVLWDYAFGMSNGKVKYKKGDFAKIYPVFKEFTTYMAQYMRICHIDRPELIAENGNQFYANIKGLYFTSEYFMLIYGRFLNDMTLTFSFFNEENHSYLNPNLVGSQVDAYYASGYEMYKSIYSQEYGELMKLCNTLCDRYLENGDDLRPTQLTK